MALRSNYPLCCHLNGEIVIEGESVSYEGGFSYFVMVDSDISLSNLNSLICEQLQIDTTKFEIKIKVKFPNYKGYKVLTLNNDNTLNGMWASVCQSNIHSLDLYIESIPIEEALCNPPTYTNMLALVMRQSYDSICLSGSANNIDQPQFEENNVEEEDNDGEDLVSLSAPIPEFNKLYRVDEEERENWCRTIIPFENEEFFVGQKFNNKKELVEAVKRYHIKRSHTFFVYDSRPELVIYKCNRVPNPCTWHLRASKKDLTEAFTIITYKGPHLDSCVGDTPLLDHPNLNSDVISKEVRSLVGADWGLKVCVIQSSILDRLKFTISYKKAWNAKQKAMSELFGDWDESYALLPRYLEALKSANPGTVVHFNNVDINSNEYEQFDKVFWAFGPSIRGFEHCRPVITVDGTHLYGKYKHVLLIAMGVDANDGIFPLAFGIVEKECPENWGWFFACLRCFVVKNRDAICVISDRHVGILQTMNDVGWEEPRAFHRYCIRHVASNVNTKYKCNKLKEQFSTTAKAHQIKNWKKGMEVIEKLNPQCKAYLDGIEESKWSMAHDGGRRYGIRTSNLAECFNGVLRSVRFLPITALVQATFFRLNSYFVKRREKAKKRILAGLPFTSKPSKKMLKISNESTQHIVRVYSKKLGHYGVDNGNHNATHMVNLLEGTCECNKWQIYHYPCSHVMAVCRSEKIAWTQYVDHFYSNESYLASYTPTFAPPRDEAYWTPYQGKKLFPKPSLQRGQGRPKSSRIHNEMDIADKTIRKTKCSLCNGEGHNKRTCQFKASTSGN